MPPPSTVGGLPDDATRLPPSGSTSVGQNIICTITPVWYDAISNIILQVCLMSQSWDSVASMHDHLLTVHAHKTVHA